MLRRSLVPAVIATGALLVPVLATGASASVLPPLHTAAAGRHAHKHKHKRKPAPLPTIRRITPKRVAIGGTLRIVGRNFVPGKRRDTVVFLRKGAPAVFLKAARATRTRITVRLTSKLGRYLVVKDGAAKRPTKFRLRVLAKRFGARFTSARSSPTVLPKPTAKQRTQPTQPAPAAPVCSLATAKAAPQADADGDGLRNALEAQIGTDPCNADTDGDTIPDGYEYESALDLNSRALPFPGKRPYPNALDPTDANTDYDGDGLTMADEHAAWVRYGGSRFPLDYSDGTQATGGPVPVTPQTAWQDLNGDGVLTDDEKDLDGDGITNWDEAHGRMVPSWWQAAYTDEQPYPLAYQQTDWLDPDTDGDGLRDGADDVDHDGWSNAAELARTTIWVQPFNPCLPDPQSATCQKHPPFDSPYPPFRAGDLTPGEPIPLSWPR